MTILQWNDAYSVNIALIDNQHRKLVDMINQLHDAMKTGAGSQAIDEILTNMTSYCEAHFATEETLFEQYSYPGALAHQSDHQNFIKKVAQLREKSQKSKIGLSMEVMTFLKDWLNHHILEVDQKYAPFLAGRGLL